MAKPEWGVKRACLACGARFYDMRKDPIVCPNCGVRFDVESIFRPRRARVQADEAPVRPEKPAVAAADDIDEELAALADDTIVDDDEEDDDAIEDTSDLADDESDVPIVPKEMEDDGD